MLTAFGAKRNYISKLMSNPNNTVLINNMPGATSQVNPQLNKLPGVINEAASGSIEASSPKSVDVAQTTPRATPEAKLETSESSDTSIPTARHNVNSGQAENSGNPFDPAYKRNAAPSRSARSFHSFGKTRCKRVRRQRECRRKSVSIFHICPGLRSRALQKPQADRATAGRGQQESSSTAAGRRAFYDSEEKST